MFDLRKFFAFVWMGLFGYISLLFTAKYAINYNDVMKYNDVIRHNDVMQHNNVIKHNDVMKHNATEIFIPVGKIFKNETSELWEEEIRMRKRRTAEICKKYPKLFNLKVKTDSFIWEKRSHLTHCGNPKASSTSWSYLMASLSNFSTRHRDDRKLYLKSEDEEIGLKNSILFTTVRHPFTRLVSAYRDKVTTSYGKGMSNVIINMYRKRGNETKNFNEWMTIMKMLGIDEKTYPTFEEFASCVGDQLVKGAIRFNNHGCNMSMNMHWKPYFSKCNPCVMDYNVTVKTETFSTDFQNIKRKSLALVVQDIWREDIKNKIEKDASAFKNFNNDIYENIPLKNLSLILDDDRFKSYNKSYIYFHGNKSKIKISTDDLTRKFWSLLSDDLKLRLRNAYKYDFELYNYDPFQFG